MDELIAKLPEVYQDIEINGELIAKGIRDCKIRWSLIKDYIEPHDVVFDVGSSLGYFSHKIAKTYPDSLVVSFEKEENNESGTVMVDIQKEIFRREGIYNVIVCHHRLTKEDLLKWIDHAEVVDTVLLLAVLHHFPAKDLPSVWDSFKKLAPKQIVELAMKESSACGGDAKAIGEKLLEDEEDLDHLGSVTSHLDKIRRIMVNHTKVARTDLDAFFGVSHPDRHKFSVMDGKINGKHIIKGVNVWNLLHFNIVWPPPKWWRLQTRRAYACLDRPTDIRPWNLLLTSTGVVAIDAQTKFPEGEKGEYNPEDIEKLDRLFETMNPKEYEISIS